MLKPKNTKYKKGYLYAAAVLLCLIFTGVVYAAATDGLSLTIGGTATLNSNGLELKSAEILDEWDNGYEIQRAFSVAEYESVEIAGLSLFISVALSKPGDSRAVEFTLFKYTTADVVVGWEKKESDFELPAGIKITWPDFDGIMQGENFYKIIIEWDLGIELEEWEKSWENFTVRNTVIYGAG